MEKPIFVAREPRVFAIPSPPPLEGRVFVTDQSRWYERLKDDNGNAQYAHVADNDEDFHRQLEEADEPAVVELTEDDALAEQVLEEFARVGRLYPEVPVIEDEDLAAA